MKCISGAIIVGVLASLASTASSQNLVGNGSFENPAGAPSGTWMAAGSVPEWDSHHLTCGGPQTDIELWGPVHNAIIEARDQLQHLEISAFDPMQAVCQKVTTLLDACPATFSFWYTGRPGYDNDFTVELSGSHSLVQPLSAVTYSPPVATGWQQFSTVFVPGPGDLTIEFRRNGPGGDHGGAHIDDVQLTQDCLRHFACYKAPHPFLIPPTVTLQDRFSWGLYRLSRAKFLCPPTNKLDEDPSAPLDPEHLTHYQTKQVGLASFAPTTLTLVDQFHPSGFTARPVVGSHLLVPTVKSLTETPMLPSSFSTDHFRCYRASFTGDFPISTNVTLEDQFGPTVATLRRPRYLCVPVNKNNEDPTAPSRTEHLVCYGVSSRPLNPPIEQAFVNNQFGPDSFLKIRARKTLCVPAKEM